MTTTRPAAAVLGALLVLTAACGSGEDAPAAQAGTSATTSADATTEEATDDAAEATTEEATDDTTDDTTDCTADEDSDNLSGSATVLFTADTAATVGDADVTPATTFTYQDDGTLSPTTMSVAVGEAFGVTTPAGGGIHATAVGCADAQTIAPGAISGFQITAAGTYELVDEISGEVIGTVTVG